MHWFTAQCSFHSRLGAAYSLLALQKQTHNENHQNNILCVRSTLEVTEHFNKYFLTCFLYYLNNVNQRDSILFSKWGSWDSIKLMSCPDFRTQILIFWWRSFHSHGYLPVLREWTGISKEGLSKRLLRFCHPKSIRVEQEAFQNTLEMKLTLDRIGCEFGVEGSRYRLLQDVSLLG